MMIDTTIKRRSRADPPPDYSSGKSKVTSEHLYSSPVQFKYGDLFVGALLPPILVLLAFGGRPSLIVLCFGAMFAYIFDILGAMEATVLTIIVTLMCEWGTLIYASRSIVEASLINMGILAVLSALLVMLFFALAGQFRGLRTEFESTFYFTETMLMATIPLVASTVLTWFVCVEFPGLDLSTTFAIIYYVYIVFMGSPRQSSHPSARVKAPRGIWDTGPYVLSVPIICAVYLIPLVLCPALHITVHHNVTMAGSMHRLLDFMNSFLLPLLGVVLAAERHTLYWADNAVRGRLVDILFSLKMWITWVLSLTLQTNSFVEEVKGFSGIREPYASVTTIAAASFLLLAVYIHCTGLSTAGSGRNRSLEEPIVHGASAEGYTHSNSGGKWSAAIADACVSASLILIAGLLGIIDMGNKLEALFIVGLIVMASQTLMEFYQHGVVSPKDSSVNRMLLNALLVAVAAVVFSLGMHSFTQKHLRFLDLTLMWQGVGWNVDIICWSASVMGGLAVMVPPLLKRPSRPDIMSLGYVPTSSPNSVESLLQRLSSLMGSFFFLVLAVAMAAFELMLREQDWSAVVASISSPTEAVYPMFLLATSSALLLAVSVHMVSTQMIGPGVLVNVVTVQLCKLLHLCGLPSSFCFSVMLLVTSLVMPFVVHVKDGWTPRDSSAEGVSSIDAVVWTPYLSWLEVIVYPLWAAVSCYRAQYDIIPSLLLLMADSQPSAVQCGALGIALWMFFAAVLVLVFWRPAALLRSVLCLAGGFFLLVASNALGPINLVYDPTAPTWVTVQMLASPDDDAAARDSSGGEGIYFILSGVLCVFAFSGLMSLKTTLQRLLYLVTFSYCAARALEQWVFPLTVMNSVVTADDDMFSFPWLCCVTSTFVATSVVLNASASQATSSTGSWVLAIFICNPFGFLIWTLMDAFHEHYVHQVFWVAAITIGAAAICCRILEISRHGDPLYAAKKAAAKRNTGSSSISYTESVCTICAVVSFFFAVLISATDRHRNMDFDIPLAALVFLTVRHGGLLPSTPSAAIAILLSSCWWTMSGFYSVALKGHDGLQFLHGFATPDETYGFFSDRDVSAWSGAPDASISWLTYLHIALLLLPLPSIVLSFLRRNQESEALIFVLAATSCLSAVCSQIWSIRFLGLAGALYGGWRCYDIENTQSVSKGVI